MTELFSQPKSNSLDVRIALFITELVTAFKPILQARVKDVRYKHTSEPVLFSCCYQIRINVSPYSPNSFTISRWYEYEIMLNLSSHTFSIIMVSRH